MKKFIAIFLSTLLLIPVYAQDAISATDEQNAQPTTELPNAKAAEKGAVPKLTAEQIAQKADTAYTADNFAQAEELYLRAIAEGGTSAVIFYNLGNAYYRQGFPGKAIVYYERALKLDPTFSDAKANLEFVKTRIADKQSQDNSVLSTLWLTIATTFHANTWAWLSVVLFAIFLSALLVYLFSSVVPVRKVSFFGGGIIFILCVLCICISFTAANRVTANDEAIILTPASQLSTSPREPRTQSEEALLLHEGTKVQIIDSISSPTDGKWYEVRVGSDRAWINASDVERI